MDFIRKHSVALIEFIVTATFLYIFLLGINTVMDFGNNVNDRARMQASAQEYARYASYDGTVVTGGEVRSAARQYSRSVKFYIYVDHGGTVRGYDVASYGTACPTPNPTTGIVGNSNTSSCPNTTTLMSTETSPAFIPLNNLYQSMILKDARGRIAGLYFKKV